MSDSLRGALKAACMDAHERGRLKITVNKLNELLAAHPAESAPRPVIDREAVGQILRVHCIECTGPGEVTCRGCRGEGWMSWPEYRRHITDAVMKLARPMPTQADLTDWLREIFTADPGGTPFGTAAEELLALISGSKS
ncbi:MAG TPA: hypothetical protein VGL05_19660 [Kribbella sp.]